MSDAPISIFISYAHADSPFVDRMEADLQKLGFDPWVDRQRLKGGQRWRRELQEAVKSAQMLLIVLSPDAVASQNVQIEYDYVLELGKVLIPLYYRQCEVPMELRAIQWIDFRHSYDEGLAALLQVLHEQQDKITSTHPAAPTQPSDLGQQPAQKEPDAARHTPFNNLPAQLTPLIGREQEVQDTCTLMRQQEVRLVTLVGTGGVGKTRLGLQLASELLGDFADGVCFVPLAPLSDPALVVPTIAKTLSLREDADQSALEHLEAYLREKEVLLLLDNFEQILSAGPALTELLLACPQLKILVTSRAVLHLQGEYEFAVPPLALPDLSHFPSSEELTRYAAIALFMQRAKAIKPDFQLTTANARTIADICRHLDGLPLAIELAAARLKLLPPQMLLVRLSQRLQVLTGGPRDSPARQQTLQNTIAWSYDLLTPEEQRLFRRLSVFVGGWSWEAVEAVCNAAGDLALDLLEGIGSLLDKSLVQQTEREAEEPRLMMLETIREFGLEVLTTSGEREAIQSAHAVYYLRLVEEAEPHLIGAKQVVWLKRLDQEYENVRAVLEWSLQGRGEEVEIGLRLIGALQQFWYARGYSNESRIFLEQALLRSEEAKAAVRAKVFNVAAFMFPDEDQAEALSKESLALYRQLGDRGGMAEALSSLGQIVWNKGDFAAGRALLEENLALERERDNQDGIAWTLICLGCIALDQGDYARAPSPLEESLALFREQGDKLGIAYALHNLARVFVAQGDPARASSLAEESLALFKEVDNRSLIATTHRLLGSIFLQGGDTHKAQSLFEENVAVFRKLEDRRNIAVSLYDLANVLAVQYDYVQARALYQESLEMLREICYKGGIDIPPCLERLATTVAAQGEPIWAVHLWGLAEVLRESIGVHMSPIERTTYEVAVAAAHSQLGEQTFAAAWQEGRTMKLEQVIDDVLKRGDEADKQ